MIRSEPADGVILRLYPAQSKDKYAPYSAACVVVVGEDGIPEIKALAGQFHTRYLRELVQWFLVRGTQRSRPPAHQGTGCPGAVSKGDFWHWDQSTLRRLAGT